MASLASSSLTFGWPVAGDNGRGIEVDDAGRVYVAGGPAAEVRVFDAAGTLLAELPTGEAGSFLNDIWVGKDGAAYVTDSSLPRIWRVTQQDGEWVIELWRDVSDTITYTPALTDFDLGGVVGTSDGRYLLTTQGTTGQLWRIDISTKAIIDGGCEWLAAGQCGRHRAPGPRSLCRTELQPSDHQIAPVGRFEQRGTSATSCRPRPTASSPLPRSPGDSCWSSTASSGSLLQQQLKKTGSYQSTFSRRVA